MDRSILNSSMSAINKSFSVQTTPKSRNRKSIFPKSMKNVSISGRSNASTVQIVTRSEYNIVEVFGNSLPIKITELLTFSERNTTVSVAYSTNGWAWAVCGRKLLIWQYKGSSKSQSDSSKLTKTPSTSIRSVPSLCRELTLPHCDIGHKARLINVFVPEGSQTAACLAVSTTGDVRFWPSIAHDGSSLDENGILEGQEFDQLINLSPQGYLLVTTTCNLVLLQIQIQGGRQRIVHRTIKPPTGFFGGFGKKFASILIGMNSNQDSENKLIKITYEAVNSIEYHVNILSEHSLARWLFSPNSSEVFLYEEQEISKKIREYFRTKMWPNRSSMNEPIDMWMLDMQTIDRGVMILAAGANLGLTPQVFLVLITVIAEADNFQIKDLQLVRYKIFYNHQQQNLFVKFKFIICRGMAYIYSDRLIIPVIIQHNTPLQPPIDDIEKIEFHLQDDRLLAAENIAGLPLFFSRIHGIVCVTPSDFEPDFLNSSMNVSTTNLSTVGNIDVFSPQMTVHDASNILSPSTTNTGNLSVYSLDPEQIRENNRDVVSQLKAAFIYHLKRNSSMCHQIINELFGKHDGRQTDSELDKTICCIAKDIAEDIPASDPRWEQELSNKSVVALGSSTSMQIIQQLREKNFCMIKFVEFLHGVGLWSKLMGITEKGNVKITTCLLSDINEKIVAAIALRCLHQAHSRLIDEAIDLIFQDNNSLATGSLTNQDIFYTSITSIQDIFRKFMQIIENLIQQEVPNHQVQNTIIEINTIILQVLQEILKFRQQNTNLYKVQMSDAVNFEYQPWTAASDENGLRDTLLQIIQLTLQHGIRLNGEGEYRFKHYQHMTDLIDFVLDGRRNFLTSIRNNPDKLNVLHHQYESQRFDLIFPLVEDEQYELAAKLAEKYLDFQILVIICDKTENQIRLDEYIERFKEQNFSQFAISWHMKQNKQGDLFERFRNNQAELAKFLNNHPSLAWIQLMFNGEMGKAAAVLMELAQNEVENVMRKKTMLSLSKLSAYASEMDLSQQIEVINRDLHLIEHQNQIDPEILTALGFNVENMRVLQPEEMIELYISEDYTLSTEIEFRKALELTIYVEDSIDYRNKIWCAAIRKDNWLDINMDAPLDKISETIFYKLVELCYVLDNDLQTFVPRIDTFLTSIELESLLNEKAFVFLIKLAYEHIIETFK
ncbi:hypothetical protein PVAND_002761 [Polypedilum vanderplanki]|uniref:Nucleoporin Nup133/Nup155-like N-terminal domain-containing protein n=1 Tax=Polypedilum vanderplanki TaxID=319348 RepID=A0A9J6BSG1_POLVA|nr:hypothetical protein PVAND_002761 [Polypedilum vanderplanki]